MSLENKIIIRMSKVSDQEVSTEDKELLLNEKYQEMRGLEFRQYKSEETIGEPHFRKIKNGSDIYDVADRTLLIYEGHDSMRSAHEEYDEMHCYNLVRHITVKHNKDLVTLCISKQGVTGQKIQNTEDVINELASKNASIFFLNLPYSEQVKPTWLRKEKVNYGNIDINDINAIRYACKDDEQIAYFLDKYVIVTPEERKQYKEYAKKMAKLEKEQLRQKQKEEREKRKQAELKSYQEQLKEKTAKDIKLKKESRFFGK